VGGIESIPNCLPYDYKHKIMFGGNKGRQYIVLDDYFKFKNSLGTLALPIV
jgi:hypothetical protein